MADTDMLMIVGTERLSMSRGIGASVIRLYLASLFSMSSSALCTYL